MKIGNRTCLICNCEGTLPLDAQALAQTLKAEEPRVARQLCRTEISRLGEVGEGERLLLACTQEHAIVEETLRERWGEEAGIDLALVNIRERAGWSREGARAMPKIAALLAEAALEREPVPGVVFESQGVALVYGRDETAIEAARLLAGKLDVTVLLSRPHDIIPPRATDFPVLRGTVRNAKGYLGAFELVVDDYAAPAPFSRAVLEFGPARAGAVSQCDVILDMSGRAPLFPAGHKRDGYLRADPGSPAAVLEAVMKAGDLTGTFDKPRYVNYRADLCAHSRNRRTGCTRCLDVCPTGAITPDGDHVAIDPYVCAGCGACNAVCPTGAATYADPAPNGLVERVRVLLSTYRRAGGQDPVLLVHDGEHGAPLIDLLARLGDGLPARVIPFEVNEVTQLGIEFFAATMASGAAEVRLLVSRRSRDNMGATHRLLETVESVLLGLGFGPGRCAVIEADDPDDLGAMLYGMASRPGSAAPQEVLSFGDKRTLMKVALDKLHSAAPTPVAVVALPEGAPFGRIAVDTEGCTLCFSCVNVCPTEALRDNAEKPELSIVAEACVQCGLCANTCPENVITLVPQIDFTERAGMPVVLKEEEPAYCIRCNKAFGVRSSIERIAEMLAGKHWMYSGPNNAIDRVRMCADCRVVAHVENSIDPYAGPARPRPRMAADFPSGR